MRHTHQYELYIRSTPEQLWQALTDGEISEKYYFNTRVSSTWQKGAPYDYSLPNGDKAIVGSVVEVDAPYRLVTTFKPLWAGTDAPVSQVTFEIEPKGRACKFTMTHDMLDAGVPVPAGIVTGWANIASSLKSLLETGEPLAVEE